jgi:hypothetical protein
LPLKGLKLDHSTINLATITNELQGLIDPLQHLQMTTTKCYTTAISIASAQAVINVPLLHSYFDPDFEGLRGVVLLGTYGAERSSLQQTVRNC